VEEEMMCDDVTEKSFTSLETRADRGVQRITQKNFHAIVAMK
jgi:hypothetical protein